MTVGVLLLDLFIPQSESLKSKRQILKSLKDKMRHKFNVSVAEIGSGDKWQRQSIAVACVNSDKRLVEGVLAKAVELVEAQGAVELLDWKIETEQYGTGTPQPGGRRD